MRYNIPKVQVDHNNIDFRIIVSLGVLIHSLVLQSDICRIGWKSSKPILAQKNENRYWSKR